jgi:1,4-dihydroxy-2-naphthoate octaprenyltransferase
MNTKTKTSARPPLWKVWWVACRPHTLTASLAPVVVSYNAGLSLIEGIDKSSFVTLTIQWAAFCMLMQLGTNLHNDYADFVKGADTEKRVGQARATQKGWLTPTQTAMASSFVLGVGLLLGVVFLSNIQEGSSWTGRTLVMEFIVITSIFNAVAYTGGPWPLGYIGLGNFSIGYSGLGDIFVFLYFGLVATLTLPFLYVSCTAAASATTDLESLLWALFPYAIQVGALGTNIIVVNNLRDRHTDVDAQKRTLAVRFGASFCRTEYSVMVGVAYGLVLLDWSVHNYALARLLPLVSFPLAWKELQAIYKKDGGALNPHVGGTAKVQFLFCILLGIGVRIS